MLELQEIEKPKPADNQVLVKVYAASLNKKDLAPIRGNWIARLLGTGLRKPKYPYLGSDIAGKVEEIGTNVIEFRPGDLVFGAASIGFAEYVCARQDLLFMKPPNVSFEEASAVPVAAISALQGLRKGQIRAGQKVLIYGASGGVGMLAVQIAKSFETEVTALCSTANVDNARRLGADHVVDYTQDDFTEHGLVYDLILAVNGQRSLFDYRNALSPQGYCIVVGGAILQVFQALVFGPLLSKQGGRQIKFMGIARLNHDDLSFLAGLLGAGKIKPLIERQFPLEKTAEALLYLEEGHARAKIVITMPHA